MNNLQNTILVSVCVQTYQHFNYIRKCLDGILMQKVNFLFEVLVRDDASTDGTRDIIKEYSKKYPDLIKPLLYKENQFRKGVRPFADNVKRAKGKYIALCEGDDYWTDPYKLQKQVDFLEANPEYGMVHTRGVLHYQSKGRKKLTHHPTYYKRNDCFNNRDVFLSILLGKYSILTCSVCFRTNLLEQIDLSYLNKGFKMGDTPLWLEISYRSKIKYFPEPMVVHNILEESVSKSKDMKKLLNFSKSGFALENYMANKFNLGQEIKQKIAKRRYRIFLDIAFRGRLKEDGIKAYYKLKKFSNDKKIGLIPYIQFYSLKCPFIYAIGNILIKIINKYNSLLSYYRREIINNES